MPFIAWGRRTNCRSDVDAGCTAWCHGDAATEPLAGRSSRKNSTGTGQSDEELLYEEVRHRLDLHELDVQRLDTRAGVLLALLSAFSTAYVADRLTAHPRLPDWSRWPIALSIVVLTLVVLYFTFLHRQARREVLLGLYQQADRAAAIGALLPALTVQLNELLRSERQKRMVLGAVTVFLGVAGLSFVVLVASGRV